MAKGTHKAPGFYWTINKICFLMLTTARGTLSTFTSVMFHEATHPGQSEEIFAIRPVSKPSYLKCATLCLENRQSGPWCVAFQVNTPDMTCDLYALGETQLPDPSIPLFWFEVTDVFHTISVQGHLYSIYLSSVPKTFSDARSHCQEIGGYLLEIDSLEEYEAIAQVANRQSKWHSYVGANDIEVEDSWVTDRDGTVLDPSVWLWGPHEPNNYSGVEDCVVIRHGQSRIADVNCVIAFTFLCERDAE